MSWGKSRQEVPEAPPTAATTTVVEEAVVEEAVVEGVPEGYAAAIEEKEGLLELREAADDAGPLSWQAEAYDTKRGEVGGQWSPKPFYTTKGQRRGVLHKGGASEGAAGDVMLPAYPEEPSGEAAYRTTAQYAPRTNVPEVTPETASEVYLRRLNRPAEEVTLRGGAVADKRGVRSLGLMDFGTLNQTYDHMSIPLLTEYISQLESIQTGTRNAISKWDRKYPGEVGVDGRIIHALVSFGSKEERDEMLKGRRDAAEDLVRIKSDIKQTKILKNQMQRIRSALMTEAKSDKK